LNFYLSHDEYYNMPMTTAAPIYVDVRRAGVKTPLDLVADLTRARWLAHLLDAKWKLFGVRVGLDGIIGFVPVVGDTILLVAALFPIYVAKRHNLGNDVIARMLLNVAIDYFSGLVPIIGDVFDVLYRANLRNLAILERAVQQRTER